ncbi:MAG: hypothetical protein KFW07_01345 [Mycoplasmataceae bacterium]|nr:hypothetical protein [Mycoplasmataceae bacterium]
MSNTKNSNQSISIKLFLLSVIRKGLILNLTNKELYMLQEDSFFREFKSGSKINGVFNNLFTDKSSFVELCIFWILVQYIPDVKEKLLQKNLSLEFGNQNDNNKPDFTINNEIFEITGFFLDVLTFKQNNIDFEKSLSSGVNENGKIVMDLDSIIEKMWTNFKETIENKIKKPYINSNVVNLIMYHGHVVLNGFYSGIWMLWEFFKKNQTISKSYFEKLNKIYLITYSQTTNSTFQIRDDYGTLYEGEKLNKTTYDDYIIEIDFRSIPEKNESFDSWSRRIKVFKI